MTKEILTDFYGIPSDFYHYQLNLNSWKYFDAIDVIPLHDIHIIPNVCFVLFLGSELGICNRDSHRSLLRTCPSTAKKHPVIYFVKFWAQNLEFVIETLTDHGSGGAPSVLEQRRTISQIWHANPAHFCAIYIYIDWRCPEYGKICSGVKS